MLIGEIAAFDVGIAVHIFENLRTALAPSKILVSVLDVILRAQHACALHADAARTTSAHYPNGSSITHDACSDDPCRCHNYPMFSVFPASVVPK